MMNCFNDVFALGTWLHSQNRYGQHIAVIGENSYEQIVCFLAITCGRNIAVPIDKELPENEKTSEETLIHEHMEKGIQIISAKLDVII